MIGVDWRLRLDDAWRLIGHEQGLQGNLDPAVLLAAGRDPPPRRPRCSTRRPAGPATSSTSATACCRKRPWKTSCAMVEAVHAWRPKGVC